MDLIFFTTSLFSDKEEEPDHEGIGFLFEWEYLAILSLLVIIIFWFYKRKTK